ncbi:probable g-protein coupled receptor [Lynx pardinus]|uniref:Probable g-protein coupled receptor n=1 Tax=Lynx pardinus TaxID=191816 RepID=A0A485NJB2_LYNPA|nr:probable g-protein coupled receptor [Lynx pardinus]
MKEHIICQKFYGLILMLSGTFLSDALSLKGKRLDFYGRADTYVSLTNTVPELSRFTACIDLVFVDDKSSGWMAFSYITNNTFLGREDVDLGLARDHQQLILSNSGRTFYIRYQLTPFQWHTICLIWDGVKGRLELFLNTERILVVMDQPQSLTPNGTLILGHFLKNWDSQVKSPLPGFAGSLYYFQLWDHVLENEDFMKCLDGNVVSWEEDVWLINKIIPTVDMRLRCFVYENITTQEMSTTLSQQIDVTTPSQVTGLKPQETVYSSTMMFKSTPVFATDYATVSYSNTTSPLLETVTAPKLLKTSVAGTARFTADSLSTSAAITLPTKGTSTGATTNSMKITKSPSSESTGTTKMAEAIATETFPQTAATNFPYTSGFTKDSIIPKTSVTGSQSAIMKTTSAFSSVESTPVSTTSWPKQKSTGTEALSIFTASQEFLTSTDAGTVPRSTVEQTPATATHVGTVSAFPPGSVLISTVAPGNSVFPRNRTAATLAITDTEITSTVHSKPLPTRPVEMMPVPRTAEAELTSIDFQDVSSPRMEDTISTFIPEKASSMALSFRTSSPFTGAQDVQTVSDAETTHPASTPGVTPAATVAETVLPPTTAGPTHTQNTPTDGGNMPSLNSTRSASTVKAYESGPTSITDDGAQLLSTGEATWASRPDQTLLTLAFHGSASNAEHSSTTSPVGFPPEAPSESEATPVADAIITADGTTDRYTTALSNSTASWLFVNFSTVSRPASVTTLPEFKLTTFLLKTTPMSTAAGSEVLSTPGETVAPPVGASTVADTEPNFSTGESASETILTETSGTIACGGTTAPVAESAKTQRYEATVTRKETAAHCLEGKSTIAVTTERPPSATMPEATDESAQRVTASVAISPFPDIEKLTTPLENRTATTEVRGSWLSTKSMKTTPKSSYDGTTEIFNSTHTYTAHRTSEAPPEGNPTPSPISGSAQTFPEPLGASTRRILGTSFATIPTDMTAMSLPAGILPPQPTATHSSATPVPSAPAATASVSPLGQTASATSHGMPTHGRSIHTTSEATVIAVSKTPATVLSLTERPVPSWRPPTPLATKAETTHRLTSADTVTPFTPTLVCSKSISDNIPVVSSTRVISTRFTPVTTRPVSQVEETSTHALSFLHTLSSSGDVVSLATSTTETSVVNETMSSDTSAHKASTSVDDHISQSSAHLGNTLVPTLLVTDVSTLPSDKEQMTTSLGNASRTMEVTEMSPAENPFISDSQSTSSLEMTDTGAAESPAISTHQTRSPSDFPLATPPDRISASPPASGSIQTTSTSLSSHTGDAHIPEMSTVTSGTTRVSNPVDANASLSNLLPPKTQTELTSGASPISESTQTSPEFLSLSTTGPSGATFTLVSTDGVTTALSAPNVPTVLLGKTSTVTVPASTLDVAPRPASKSTLFSSAFITSEGTEVSSRITPTSSSSPSVGTTASSLLSSRNTEAMSSIPKTTFSPFLATTHQSSQNETATLGILPGTTEDSLSPVSSSTVTALTNTSSGTDALESEFSSTPSGHPHTSSSIQVSPSFTSFKSTPGHTKRVKATTYLSSNTEKKTSWSENTSTAEPTKGATSVKTPVSYSPWAPSIATPPSLTSLLFSPHRTEAKFSTPKTFLPLTSQMVEFPVLGTRTTPSNTQPLLMTSWNPPTAKGSQFPIFTSTHVPTPHKTETEIPYLVPGSLSTFAAPQTGLISGDVMAKPSISTSGFLPTLGMSDSPSSTSSRSIPITLADTKHTFEKTATSVTLGTTLPSNHSGATSGSILSKATSSPTLAWILSTLPSGSPLSTVSSTPHIVTSSTVKLSEPTSLTSDRTSTRSFTNFTTPSFATVRTALPETTPTPAVGSIGTGFPTSLPVSGKLTVSFYNIEMSFSVFDEDPRIPVISVVKEFAENWLNSIFQDSEFAVANLAIQIKSSCVCQVILKANSSLAASELISRIERKIHGNLTRGNFTQGQLMLLVASEHIAVEKLEPGRCKAQETVSKYKGTYKWLLTNPTETAQTRCIKNRDGNATRVCSINMETGKSQWEKPKLKQCKLLQGLPDKIVDLANVTISDENAGDAAQHILNLINESPTLDEDETKIIVSKVSDISQCHEISMNLTQMILQIISAVLGKQNNSASDLREVRNEILRIIERAGHKMEFFGRTANLTAASLALAILRVDHTFEGMAFSIHSYNEGADPEIYLGEVPLGRILASIYLPKSLRGRIPLGSLHTILFNFFGQTSLFKTKNVTKALTTFVVSASVSHTSIQNLADPVVISLQHVGGNQNYDQVHCAFWDFGSNDGQGGWNSSGCKVKETDVNHTICQCDHLTHFGVLMQTSKRSSFQNPDQPVHSTTDAKPGISGQFLVRVISDGGTVYHSRRGASLLPARFFDLDGPGGGPHVYLSGPSLQHLRSQLYP